MLKHSTSANAIQNAQAILENTQKSANGAISDMSHALGHTVDRARDAGSYLRDGAHHLSQDTSNVIRHEPVKSVLIAAATGAALMALVGLLTRAYSRH